MAFFFLLRSRNSCIGPPDTRDLVVFTCYVLPLVHFNATWDTSALVALVRASFWLLMDRLILDRVPRLFVFLGCSAKTQVTKCVCATNCAPPPPPLLSVYGPSQHTGALYSASRRALLPCTCPLIDPRWGRFPDGGMTFLFPPPLFFCGLKICLVRPHLTSSLARILFSRARIEKKKTTSSSALGLRFLRPLTFVVLAARLVRCSQVRRRGPALQMKMDDWKMNPLGGVDHIVFY